MVSDGPRMESELNLKILDGAGRFLRLRQRARNNRLTVWQSSRRAASGSRIVQSPASHATKRAAVLELMAASPAAPRARASCGTDCNSPRSDDGPPRAGTSGKISTRGSGRRARPTSSVHKRTRSARIPAPVPRLSRAPPSSACALRCSYVTTVDQRRRLLSTTLTNPPLTFLLRTATTTPRTTAMAPATKKAAATAVVTGLVVLSVTPSISGAPAAAVAAGAAAAAAAAGEAAYPRLTASALAALDASTRQASPAPEDDDKSSHASHASHASDEPHSSHASHGAEEGANDVGDSSSVPDPDDSADCFPAFATVELADGRVVPMADVAVGDKVRVAAGDAPSAFSSVFLFTHKMPTAPRAYVRLALANGHALVVSAGHYVYADGKMVAAAGVAVGSTVQVSSSVGAGWVTTPVTAVTRVNAAGLYNPQTLHGDIVVDGVRASTFTTAVEPTVASALLAPLRALYRSTGQSVGLFEGGGGVLTSLAPRGKAVVC